MVARVVSTRPGNLQLYVLPAATANGLCRPMQITKKKVYFFPESRDGTRRGRNRKRAWSDKIMVDSVKPAIEDSSAETIESHGSEDD